MFKILYKLPLHPINELNEIKQKRLSYTPASLIAAFLFFFSYIVQFQYTDFAFNLNRIDKMNIFVLIFQTLIIFFLWVLSNWAFCTLFDGEGSFKQIFCVTAIGLIPYSVSLLLKTMLSHVFVLEEAVFINFIVIIGILYSGFLILVGLQKIHDYSFKKTIFSAIISVAGILIITFLGLLFFELVQQFLGFVSTIYTELSLIID